MKVAHIKQVLAVFKAAEASDTLTVGVAHDPGCAPELVIHLGGDSPRQIRFDTKTADVLRQAAELFLQGVKE